MFRFIGNILFFINIVAAILLLLIYFAAYIKPSAWWPIPLVSLAYPAILLSNIAFVFYWLFSKRKRRSLLSFIAILLGINELMGIYQIKDYIGTSHNEIKVISFNTLNLGYYDWFNNKVIRNNIFDVLNQEQADILCMQEFMQNDKGMFTTKDSMLTFLPSRNYYFQPMICSPTETCYGVATFSRYPIVNRGVIKFENTRNLCIYTDLLIKHDTVRVYNCHLQSYKLKNDNIDAVANIQNNGYGVKNHQQIFEVLRKLKFATLKREVQAEMISEHISKCPFPVLVCGDFNDVPTSYTYHTIKSSIGLKDAFVRSGEGFGGTYIGKLPSFRIDYILYSKHFNSSNFRVRKEKLSDHYPIVVELSFPD